MGRERVWTNTKVSSRPDGSDRVGQTAHLGLDKVLQRDDVLLGQLVQRLLFGFQDETGGQRVTILAVDAVGL